MDFGRVQRLGFWFLFRCPLSLPYCLHLRRGCWGGFGLWGFPCSCLGFGDLGFRVSGCRNLEMPVREKGKRRARERVQGCCVGDQATTTDRASQSLRIGILTYRSFRAPQSRIVVQRSHCQELRTQALIYVPGAEPAWRKATTSFELWKD